MNTQPGTNKTYDVLVLGSGLGGSISAAILARKGWRVLLIEAGTHPRFAIGEATTPDTSCRLKIMSKKYGIPEFDHLTTFHKLRDHISPACGIKKSFSFLYHREGETQNPLESHQFPTLAPPLGPDCHFFRQDTDAYMLAIALRYGAEVRQRTQIAQTDCGGAGVVLTSDKGEVFKGRFLVDASGFRSPIAQKFDLREAPTSLKTKSRAIFTHMVGVHHYDETCPPLKTFGFKYPFCQGTLHHVFDGGWMWVIPFDNHPDTTNPLCSVGILLDLDKFPVSGKDPETEFNEIIARFPSVAKQFADAKAVREWVGTGRIQYSSKTILGPRFCQIAHAAGFVDPLYSSGLNLTVSVIDDLMPELDAALVEDQFQEQRFASVDRNFQNHLRHYDTMIANAFHSFKDFELWDAWFRIWVAGNFVATCLNTNLFINYMAKKDISIFERCKQAPFSGVLGSHFEPGKEVFDRADELMARHLKGELTAKEAGDATRQLFANIKFMPSYFRWHDRRKRYPSTFTVPSGTRMFLWFALKAPKPIRQAMMAWKVTGIYAYVWRCLWAHRKRNNRRKFGYFRDTFLAKSRDWQASD